MLFLFCLVFFCLIWLVGWLKGGGGYDKIGQEVMCIHSRYTCVLILFKSFIYLVLPLFKLTQVVNFCFTDNRTMQPLFIKLLNNHTIQKKKNKEKKTWKKDRQKVNNEDYFFLSFPLFSFFYCGGCCIPILLIEPNS